MKKDAAILDDVEVLICGAGPVGLTLAVQLQAMGISFLIIDRLQQRSELSKAGVIWGRTLELIDLAMDARSFIGAGRPVRKAKFYGDGKELASVLFAGDDSEFGTGVMLPQNVTERLLSDHLHAKGIDVARGIEMLGFEQHSGRVRCDILREKGSPLTVTANYLVGCDGAHSTVRHALGLPFPGQEEAHRWLLADVRASGNLPDSEIAAFFSGHGAFFLFRFTEDCWRVIAEDRRGGSDSAREDLTLEKIQSLFDERCLPGVSFDDAIWLSEFRINERKVDRYRVGNVFLAGDSAHVHSPAGGQGMNTGMQDACNLAWKLAWTLKGMESDKLVESYTLERGRIGDLVIRSTSHITRLATTESSLLQSIRNTLAKIALHFEWTQESVGRTIAEYSICYPNSSIAGHDHRERRSGIKLGDRMPDISWSDADGKKQTLYQMLAGGHSVVLSWNSTTPVAKKMVDSLSESFAPGLQLMFRAVDLVTATEDTEMRSPSDAVGRISAGDFDGLGLLHSGLLVIRPDGYLAAAGETHDTAILRDWLQTLTGNPNA